MSPLLIKTVHVFHSILDLLVLRGIQLDHVRPGSGAQVFQFLRRCTCTRADAGPTTWRMPSFSPLVKGLW